MRERVVTEEYVFAWEQLQRFIGWGRAMGLLRRVLQLRRGVVL